MENQTKAESELVALVFRSDPKSFGNKHRKKNRTSGVPHGCVSVLFILFTCLEICEEAKIKSEQGNQQKRDQIFHKNYTQDYEMVNL